MTVTDLGTAAARWPRFAATLRERTAPDEKRYRSVHALPLHLRGQAIGGMNLFHTRPGPLPEADLLLGQALADVATIGILQERAIRHGEVVVEQLQNALNSRVDHRAGQGRARTARERADGRRFRASPPVLPRPQHAAGRRRRQVVTDPAFARRLLAVSV